MADGLGFGGGLCRHGSQPLAERVSCQADPEKQPAGRPALPGQPGQEPGSFQRQKALGQIGER